MLRRPTSSLVSPVPLSVPLSVLLSVGAPLVGGALGCSDYELQGKSEAEPGASPEDCRTDPPEAAAVLIDEACVRVEAPVGGTPTVEWQWATSVGNPGYDDVMMMPAVGDVDGDGTPEVVVTSYAGAAYGSAGLLTVLRGDGTGELLSALSIGGYAPFASSGVALGDIDADGVVEIVLYSADGRVLAAHADGTLLWASEARSGDWLSYGYPSLADLDGDGLAEVVAGRVILDHTGVVVGVGAYGYGGSYSIPVVADLDLDGQQEVIVGNAAYRRDGSAIWSNSLPDGWPAVGDFDHDGRGEVVTVYGGSVYLSDDDGTLLWGPMGVPGGGGGPPTVADFDGDGEPEVGVAGLSGYAVYDTDGSTLWTAATTDASSAQTGSAVFDFEGDGAAEVVYADELVLWVYDGATGAPLVADDRHSSWTLFEYPVIADVDADGDAEIVLASNDSIGEGWQGVTVLGAGEGGAWAPTTPTWNEHGYSISNIEDDLSIPAHPTMNWLSGHNSFRAGGLRDGVGIPAIDLLATLSDACWVCEDEAGNSVVELAVRVGNQGTGPAGESALSIYLHEENGDVTLLGVETMPAVEAGAESPALTLRYTLPPAAAVREVSVRVDDPGTVAAGPTTGLLEECDEENNRVSTAPEGCL